MNGHDQELGSSDLEDLISEGDFGCADCGKALTLDDPFDLECHICGEPFEVSNLQEAQWGLDTHCGHCSHNGYESLSYHVPDSWQMLKAKYDWARQNKETKSLSREGRTDYWEGLIHFCKAEEFGSIYNDETVKASATGYYRLPAVCLTEATAGNWEELKKVHGEFGYVFRKRDILAAGGGPAVYLPQHLIRAQEAHAGFSLAIKPFVTMVRTRSLDPSKIRHDYLHEREWRVPTDIKLETVEPFGVIVGMFGRYTAGVRDIIAAAMRYEEVEE